MREVEVMVEKVERKIIQLKVNVVCDDVGRMKRKSTKQICERGED